MLVLLHVELQYNVMTVYNCNCLRISRVTGFYHFTKFYVLHVVFFLTRTIFTTIFTVIVPYDYIIYHNVYHDCCSVSIIPSLVVVSVS